MALVELETWMPGVNKHGDRPNGSNRRCECGLVAVPAPAERHVAVDARAEARGAPVGAATFLFRLKVQDVCIEVNPRTSSKFVSLRAENGSMKHVGKA